MTMFRRVKPSKIGNQPRRIKVKSHPIPMCPITINPRAKMEDLTSRIIKANPGIKVISGMEIFKALTEAFGNWNKEYFCELTQLLGAEDIEVD